MTRSITGKIVEVSLCECFKEDCPLKTNPQDMSCSWCGMGRITQVRRVVDE